tara:strand:- start:164 stop:505 length:342 start_codon:yes stop_codon:yes gene_type:complete
MARIITAIQLIKPDADCSVSGDDINNIKWYDGNPENITAAQIEAKLSEVDFKISIQELREKRNKLLSNTDFYALSDVTMSSKMKTYRQELRDITNGLTTVEQVEAVEFPTKPS